MVHVCTPTYIQTVLIVEVVVNPLKPLAVATSHWAVLQHPLIFVLLGL